MRTAFTPETDVDLSTVSFAVSENALPDNTTQALERNSKAFARSTSDILLLDRMAVWKKKKLPESAVVLNSPESLPE